MTGDGSFGGQSQTGASAYGDILPGTNIGAFGRAVKASKLNTVIQNYNTNFRRPADSRRPGAGQCRLAFAIATAATGRGLARPSPAPPPGNVSLAWMRTLDVTLARPFRMGDRFVLEPSVSAFNVLNFANFDGPGNRLSGVLNGTLGSVNGTSATERITNRIGPGSGLFSLGAPRQIQFGVRLTF